MGQPAEPGTCGSPVQQRGNETEDVRFRPAYPRVPHSLQRICEKAMAPDQKRRYQSAAELGRALRRYRSRRWYVSTASIILAVLAALFLARF